MAGKESFNSEMFSEIGGLRYQAKNIRARAERADNAIDENALNSIADSIEESAEGIADLTRSIQQVEWSGETSG